MCRVRGGCPLGAAHLLPVLRHGKSNSTDESITEMNEDDSAVIHESRRGGGARVRVFTYTSCKIRSAKIYPEPTGHLHCKHPKASKFSSPAR